MTVGAAREGYARADDPLAQHLQALRIERLAANGNVRSMIEQDHPHPHPRPSPDMAADVDAQSFNTRLEAERRRAALKTQFNPEKGTPPMLDQAPKRPAETLREGMLNAAIWRNETENGAYHNVTLSRTYKDQDSNYRDTTSFRPKDMLSRAELARRTHHHTTDLDRQAVKEQRRAQTEPARTRSSDHTK